MTIQDVVSLIMILAVTYLITQGVKACAAYWKIDLSKYVPNIVAGATALILYFSPQIAALIPQQVQTIIMIAVIGAMGVAGGAGIHSTISRLSPTENPKEESVTKTK